MSIYTTEVRFICENYAGYRESQGFDKVNGILENCWNKVIPQDFPMFDEGYRKILCKKILQHYYTREIGFETVGLWRMKIQQKLNEIMPYYNQLYYTTTLKYNPLYEVDYKKEHEGSDSGSNTGNSNSNDTRNRAGNRVGNVDDNGGRSNTHWDLFSDTPQNGLVGVEEENYLTDARKITDNETNHNNRDYDETYSENNSGNSVTNSSGEFNNTNEYVEHVFGKMSPRPYPELIAKYREMIINIDMMIINELSDLFMLLWR